MEPLLLNADFTGARMQNCTINGCKATPELLAALGAVGTQSMNAEPSQGQDRSPAPQTPSCTLPSLANAGVSGAMNTSLGAALAAGPPPTPNNTNGPDKDGPGTMIT